jgi:serine/threonine protein kinase
MDHHERRFGGGNFPGARNPFLGGHRRRPGHVGFDFDLHGQNMAGIDALFREEKVLVRGYDMVRRLTPGGQSTAVNVVRSRANGKLYVEKCIRTDQGRSGLATRELKTLGIVSNTYGRSGNLNAMVDYKILENGRMVSMILSYCDRGTLMDRLTEVIEQRSHVSETSVWNVLQGVAHGLAFLHDGLKDVLPNSHPIPRPRKWNPICHLDLKPTNIFLSSEGGIGGHSRVVLADFGCAVSLEDMASGSVSESSQPCGTPAWYPPEGRGRQSYGTKTDIWMLGATVHVLCRLLRVPNVRVLQSPCGHKYSRELNRFVAVLMAVHVGDRPPARDIASIAMGVMLWRMG